MSDSKPIRVAHVVGKMIGGGVESFLMNYYRHIDRDKIQFDFIIDEDSTIVPREEIELLGGRIIEIPPYQKIFKYIKTLKKILRENNYKIVHSHLNALSIFPLYCAYSEKIPIRIAHSHSTTNKKEWRKNIIKNILKPFSKVFSTDYFACSEHAARWLFGNKVVDEKKVQIIYNAIDIEKFKYDENVRCKIRKELDIEDKFVIGHVGRFVEQKNHEFLVDIFAGIYKKNKNVVLLLIGDGPLEKKIREKVNKLNLNNCVYFLGIRENVNEFMQALDVFLFPSLYEGLGIVAIEAQCSNVNVICSTEVPEEIKISNNIEFCNLSDDKSIWEEKIMNISKKNNVVYAPRKDMYDINKEAIRYQEKIIELFKRGCRYE